MADLTVYLREFRILKEWNKTCYSSCWCFVWYCYILAIMVRDTIYKVTGRQCWLSQSHSSEVDSGGQQVHIITGSQGVVTPCQGVTSPKPLARHERHILLTSDQQMYCSVWWHPLWKYKITIPKTQQQLGLSSPACETDSVSHWGLACNLVDLWPPCLQLVDR